MLKISKFPTEKIQFLQIRKICIMHGHVFVKDYTTHEVQDDQLFPEQCSHSERYHQPKSKWTSDKGMRSKQISEWDIYKIRNS